MRQVTLVDKCFIIDFKYAYLEILVFILHRIHENFDFSLARYI